jgi:uncharacterized protein YjaG (DUF416 family)
VESVRFDEESMIRTLGNLPPRLRTAFALFCATRLLPAYRNFYARTRRGDPSALRLLAERLWLDLLSEHLSSDELTAAIDEGMALVPSEEDDGWDQASQPYAEDAAAALVYALRSRLTGDAVEAVRSARRAYESFDHLVQAQAGIDPITPEDEAAILSHPLLQRELSRQLRDLQELAAVPRLDVADASVLLEAMLARAREEGEEVFGDEVAPGRS